MAYRDVLDPDYLAPLILRTQTVPVIIEPEDGPSPADLQAMAASITAAEARLLKRGVEVPQWMLEAGMTIKWNGYHKRWSIQLIVVSSIKEIVYRDVWIHRPTNSRRFTVRLWLPLEKDGTYRLSALCADSNPLPHVTTGMSCLSLGDVSQKVTSYEECGRLVSSLSRGLSQVNLSSLLNHEKMKWPTELRMAIPAEVRKRIGRRRMGQLPQEVLEKYFVRQAIEREEETWQVRVDGER